MYRRPAVTVIQEFVGLVPALAAFNLPSVAVGPAYQLVNNALFGTYVGTTRSYAYADKMGGAVIDLEELSPDELFPATKKPLTVKLQNAEIEIVASASTGVGSGDSFSDATADHFEDVVAGDFVVITPVLNFPVLATQLDGESSDVPGSRDRLVSANLFANVKSGDRVVIVGGTNTIAGTFTVIAKINDSTLKLNANINDGGGLSSDIEYSIVGDRGQANEGAYRIKSKTDNNTLVLESSLVEAETMISYFVKRKVSSIEIPRSDYTATEANVELPGGLLFNTYPIIAGTVKADYRALRNDMAANVREFARLSDLQSFFGIDQITPQNPLAFGLSIMLQNTVTPINGLGLDSNAVANEVLSYLSAMDVLVQTEMYAIVPLTQNPVIHQLLRTHVEGMSMPSQRKERVGIVNRKLITEQIEREESTLDESLVNATTIVNTQVEGEALLATPTILTDSAPDKFMNVKNGDTVIIFGGTNAILGGYKVDSVIDSNNISLSGAIVSSNTSDIQYYIVRQDGLGADGITLFDRTGTFIADNVAPGYYVRFLDGLEGSYKIVNVLSDKKLEIEQVPGVTSLETGMTYEIYRDLSKTEQANAIAGYSSSLALRRLIVVWPDEVLTPVGSTLEYLPGFYMGCSLGAITTGLPVQQGFTNLTVSGFLGFRHSTGYFTDDQLDIIAGGGTMIFAQAGEDQPLFIRHQLTTDRSSIKYQEFSVTKNVDFIAKFIRKTFAPFIGVYNIVESTFDELRSTSKAVLTFLKEDTRLPRIGGVIKNGALTQLEEHPDQIDTVRMRFRMDIPIPLNNLDITLEV